MQRATIVAIIATVIVLFILDGLYYEVIMSGMMTSMPDAFKAAMKPEQPNPAVWLIINAFIVAILFWVVIGRNPSRPIDAKSAAIACATVYALVSVMFSFFFIVMMANWPIKGEVINVVYSAVLGAIGGYVMAFVHNKLSKA